MMIDVVFLNSSGGLVKVRIKRAHITSLCVQIVLPYLRVVLQWFGEIKTVYSRGSHCCHVPALKKCVLISNTQNFKTVHFIKLVTSGRFSGRHVCIIDDHATNSMGRCRSWSVSSRTVCHTRRLLWYYRPGVHEFFKNLGWTVRGSNRGGGEIFRTRSDWPCQPRVRWVPALLPGGKAAWAWRRPLTPIKRWG